MKSGSILFALTFSVISGCATFENLNSPYEKVLAAVDKMVAPPENPRLTAPIDLPSGGEIAAYLPEKNPAQHRSRNASFRWLESSSLDADVERQLSENATTFKIALWGKVGQAMPGMTVPFAWIEICVENRNPKTSISISYRKHFEHYVGSLAIWTGDARQEDKERQILQRLRETIARFASERPSS